jgi:hypothetical protein
MEYKNQLLDELEKLASFLDIPFARRRDYRWIMRNVAINNTDDKKIKKIISICQLLMKDEV